MINPAEKNVQLQPSLSLEGKSADSLSYVF